MPEQKINKQKAIKILEDPVVTVRKLPDNFIGPLGDKGFLNMYREIIQNSMDEIMKGNTLDKNIIVSFDARNYTCIIEDNGQGIDLDMLGKVFSTLYSSSNYDKEEGSAQYVAGKNGVGATITNFLSRFFVAESYRMDGTAAKVEYKEGYMTPEGVQKIKCPKGKHGLIVSFAPTKMMGDLTIDDVALERFTWELCHLCALGTRITYNAITKSGLKRKVVIENKNGIYDILDTICEKRLFDPVHFIYDNGSLKTEIVYTYDIKTSNDTIIAGYVNTCPTIAGTHNDGFLDGLTKYFKKYMNDIYLNNNKKLNVNNQDIKCGLRAVISNSSISPLFTGQSKENYSEVRMKAFTSECTIDGTEEWFKKTPSDLQKVGKYLKEICEIRTKSEGEKIKMTDKFVASAVSGLPSKYKKPNGKGPFELYIVEGDSACSGMENNRDKSCQGIFPIRGKIINALGNNTKKFFENQEVSGLFKIFGYNGYSKQFDPDKFRPEKVVIATDADADGKHIQSLLLHMFLMYLPFVLDQGKLYIANPPLYGIPVGKNKMKFFSDNIEYVEFVQNTFCKENEIKTIKKKEMTKKDITKLLYANMNYVSELEHIANTFAIDPYLLELVLVNRKGGFKKIKSVVEKAYPFTKVEMVGNVIMITGLVGERYQNMFFNDLMLNQCGNIIELIDKSDPYYIMNNNVVSLYNLMKTFEGCGSKDITRYKGLGEMEPTLLGLSTVIPGMGRTLKRYTTEDAKKELKYIKSLQSDKSAFIKGIKIKKEDIE